MADKVNIKTDIVTPLKETFEQKSKKKSSWSQTPSDDNYPSEKLTKDTLDGKEDENNKVSSWSSTTTNAHYPSEKLVKDSLDNKVDKVNGKGLSTEDYTSDEKTKLGGIETGVTKTVIDSSLSKTSENPVQNKVIKNALDGKADDSDLNNYILTSKILTDIDSAVDNTQVVGAYEMQQVVEDLKGQVPTGVELQANKKSSWTATPNNTNYPSEKLVKDSLDDKLDDSQLVTSITNLSDNNHIPSAKAVYDYVASVPKWTTAIYQTFNDLPSVGAVGTFYLVPKANSEEKNEYDEYFWNDSAQTPGYEHFGAFTIDISNLVTMDEVLQYINENGSLTLATSGADSGYLIFKVV